MPGISKKYKQDVLELSLLFEISQTLNRSTDIRKVIPPALEMMAKYMGLLNGTLTIFNREANEIFIELAYSFSKEEQSRGKYKVGEGITGKVVETGQPIIVENIDADPRFLNRTRTREKTKHKDIAFICVPVKSGEEVIGTLSANRICTADVSLQDDLRLLSIMSTMIAQSVKIHQEMHEGRERLEQENQRLHSELREVHRPPNMIGNAKGMRKVYNLISIVSKSKSTVFIDGESGVGKEMVASAIHYCSDRADNPFVKVNCAALPENLIESELFGHEKGAFTGASNLRKGRFELANRGTLFLDEIGDLPPLVQVKLLRVIQEGEIERVGGERPIKVDVRIITATNRNVSAMLKEGSFREDLYFRLNVFPIRIPALRERRTDIIPLADYFIDKINKRLNLNIKRITTAAIDMMMSYHWPGNVRELENAIERAMLLSTDSVIHSYHLPPSLQTSEESDTEFKGTLTMILDSVEKDLIIDAIKSTKGHLAKSAKLLGISERIMGLRLKKHQIDSKKFK
jgi:Nif-specific regulatory protein